MLIALVGEHLEANAKAAAEQAKLSAAQARAAARPKYDKTGRRYLRLYRKPAGRTGEPPGRNIVEFGVQTSCGGVRDAQRRELAESEAVLRRMLPQPAAPAGGAPGLGLGGGAATEPGDGDAAQPRPPNTSPSSSSSPSGGHSHSDAPSAGTASRSDVDTSTNSSLARSPGFAHAWISARKRIPFNRRLRARTQAVARRAGSVDPVLLRRPRLRRVIARGSRATRSCQDGDRR